MVEASSIPISVNRAISFLGKVNIFSLTLDPFYMHSLYKLNLSDRLFSIYHEERPDALRHRILDL